MKRGDLVTENGINDIFHVHTFRCGHATGEDENYIKAAIRQGARSITFTDHAPFPDDPFTGRMPFSQLTEYICTLSGLKNKYLGIIDVYIGLEIEFLPCYMHYYDVLKENENIDVMMLGQHHYEVKPGIYSFQLVGNDFEGLMEAQIEGIKSGYFNVVAHPDRCFRYCKHKEWDRYHEKYAIELIDTAISYNVVLEKNLSSMRSKNQYYTEFWDLVPSKACTIIGCDAHSPDDIRYTNYPVTVVGRKERKL